jgi:cytochrome oxidase assembly protein ShyY1
VTVFSLIIVEPRHITPQHDFTKWPPQFFWMDQVALQQNAGVDKAAMLTQVRTFTEHKFPVQPPLETVGELKLTPMIHAGYAFTWFGLAGAGVIMTRKLITRGR